MVDTVAEDMAAFGVKDFEPPEWFQEAPAVTEFEVLPENWEAVNVFMACAGQWTYGVAGEALALRYEALEIVMRHSKLADTDEVFAQVRVMERSALDEFSRMKKD